ncbi:phenoloxidase-activating enzyme 1-like [Choristoneura fumiferana]|uniref:phenoloxidase-activating enzyme 1-like n=1 Tax=Choristoneura fumiferana TaxID=7141 RepID=UPI003D15A816
MRVIYPCEESKTLMGDKVRRDYCRHNAGELIAGGTDAKLDEFPHMVLLGYGSNISSADWNFCAGTLISDRFILTAATCTATRL